jgi:hypothetical protein
MPEPPCLAGTHWRVLKDPIMVAPSQLRALEKLLIERIDPATCQYHTAGKVTTTKAKPKTIVVNRPLQTTTTAHQLVYCECIDWTSKSAQDVAYCQLSAAERRVFPFSG